MVIVDLPKMGCCMSTTNMKRSKSNIDLQAFESLQGIVPENTQQNDEVYLSAELIDILINEHLIGVAGGSERDSFDGRHSSDNSSLSLKDG